MLSIDMENHRAQLHASTDVIHEVRRLVSYREQELPPVFVQRIIKSHFQGVSRRGAARDLEGLYSVQAIRLDLEAAGWPQERLSPSLLEATLRQAGCWDGWRSLVNSAGLFGSGLVPYVDRALRLHMGMIPTINDKRIRPAPLPCEGEKPKLYWFQQEAVDAWLAAGGRGVINLPPRSGKTRIAIWLAVHLGLPVVMVVPTINLVRQVADQFREYLPNSMVIEVTGGRPSAKKQRQLNHALVWVATPATAAGPSPRKKQDKRQGMHGLKSRAVLIIDEFHHSAADTWQDISRCAVNAYYRLGLTGTHFRADGMDLKMHAVLSRCVYRRSVQEMIDAKRLVPARIAMVRIPGSIGSSGHFLYPDGISGHQYRNGLIGVAANWLTHLGKRVLVLTKEVEHAKELAKLITGAVQVDGSDNASVGECLKKLQAGLISCLVGTSVIGEGVDVPAADALIYASGGKSQVRVMQDYFRVLTASYGKTHGIVVDFADLHHPRLADASVQRLALYRRESAFSSEIINPDELPDWLKRVA